MKEYVISASEEGRRLDKFAMNILALAPSGFTYKMLRKKNITLNDKKASGNELLSKGDVVKFYLSDDTFDKFSKSKSVKPVTSAMPDIVYEDDDILIVNKPSGMLSQKSSATDISLNEICISYVNNDAASFPGSVSNRLDRNTSGLVTFSKTYNAAKVLASAFKDRTVRKFYKCLVFGSVDHDLDLTGSLVKDETKNTVTVYDDPASGAYINTKVHCIKRSKYISLLEIELITGKTHQIRAHLAHAGIPIIGDGKYGDALMNARYKKEYGIRSQMLCCTKMIFPDDFELAGISGKTISIDVPDLFNKVM